MSAINFTVITNQNFLNPEPSTGHNQGAQHMTKHILEGIDGFIKPKSDAFEFDPRKIKVVDGWNPRTDFSGEDELMASIKIRGVIEPLEVRKTTDKTVELVDGERRLRATMKLIEQGVDIRQVPVFVKSTKVPEITLYFDAIIKNSGKPLTPVEESTAFKRLTEWGVPIKEIADTCGRSVSHVRNRLELADAAPVVKNAVADKSITTQDAIKIVKTSAGKVDAQAHALLDKQTAPPVPRPAVLRISVIEGTISSKSKNGETCPPLMNVLNGNLLRLIEASGYDHKTLKISICKQQDTSD